MNKIKKKERERENMGETNTFLRYSYSIIR